MVIRSAPRGPPESFRVTITGLRRRWLREGYRPVAPPATRHYEITIRVRTVTQLFNSLDPSPFRERDLDPHADEFVTGWVRELPHGAPFTIVVELPIEEANRPEANRIREAFANYFRRCAEAAERDLRELFRVGWRSLLIGLVVLVACLSGSQLVAAKIKNTVVARVLEESLIIVGWVANWRPIEIYLYDWLPIRRRISLFRRIARAPVEIRSI
ncbi:hypothetical protein [Candidatus Rhodoblastus alkanivorans]|uniref:hypothetical protein n=1 Tax=Candidatus Rhodoblastus alkanivorans TaxID=2954117 RepID=UPI001FA971E6|nr:hypothetical protein [Candidatus Rhodoblastus alkanivorans]